MAEPSGTMTIGALAKAAGVGVETIRYYQRRGLLPAPARRHGGVRRYGEAERARLAFVRAAQALGFSLDEIAELLRLEDGAYCDEARRLGEGKLADVRRKLADLRRMEAALAALVGACRSARAKVACPLIASLQRDRSDD